VGRIAAVPSRRGPRAGTHGAAALLVGKGESATERHGTKQGAANHEYTAALQAKFARGLNRLLARRHELAFIEEIGVALIGVVKALRLVLVRIFDAAERDMWRLIVPGVEGLQRLMCRHWPGRITNRVTGVWLWPGVIP